jgi:O-antigen/teichoic acid export membrane protein
MLKSDTNPERGSNIAGGAAFILGCRITGALLTFGTQLILARWMGASALGVYLFAFSWCLVLSTIGGLGLPMAAIRFIGESISRSDKAGIRFFVSRGSLIVLSSSAAIMVAGILLLNFVPFPGDEYEFPVLLFALIAVPFFALLRFDTGCANALSLFPLSFIPNNIVRPALFLLLMTIAWSFGGVIDANVAMWWHLIAIGLTSAGTLILLRRQFGNARRSPVTPGDVRLWLRTSIPLLLMDLVGNFFPELTVIFVSAFLPSQDVGIYAVAFRIAMLIMFGLNAVDAFVAPKIASQYASNDRESLQQTINRATRLRFFSALAGAAVLYLSGKPLLAVFGPEFESGYIPLALFIPAFVVSAGVGPVIRILSVTGHQLYCMYALIISVILALALIVLLTPKYGVTGAAFSASISMVASSIMLRALVVRLVGLRPRFLN